MVARIEPVYAAYARERRARRLYLTALGGAVLLGALVRAAFVLGSDFPLNDGGMFYAMARDLQRAGYALPTYTSYNGAGIPFAYPPLAIYVAALLDELSPVSLLDLLRYLPLAASVLTLGAFVALCRAMLPSRLAQVFATFAFVTMARSFTWEIMGGGLTRSFGFLFALLAIHQIHAFYRTGRWQHAGLAVLTASACVLSHLEMGWFAAFSGALLFLAYGRSRRGLLGSAAIALGTLVLTSPWWTTVLARHGLSPFLAAADYGVPLAYRPLSALWFGATDEVLFPLPYALALLGVAASLGQGRHRFLPLWAAATFLLDARKALTYVTVPAAMLAGIGLAEVLLPVLRGGRRDDLLQGRLVPVTLGVLLLYSTLEMLVAAESTLGALSREERAAMAWVARATPPESRFLVVTGDAWALDASSEWFPALAERTSVATVQGNEWFARFPQAIERYQAAQACAAEGTDCLRRWSEETGIEFDYVYVVEREAARHARLGSTSGDCCAALRTALSHDPGYVLVYDGPGAVIYRGRPHPHPLSLKGEEVADAALTPCPSPASGGRGVTTLTPGPSPASGGRGVSQGGVRVERGGRRRPHPPAPLPLGGRGVAKPG